MPDESPNTLSPGGGRLFVTSAPSGTGKTTINSRLAEEGVVRVSISSTTRPAREGEKHGVQYFFVSKEEFLNMRDQGAFLEWAEVYGYYYGTSKEWVFRHLSQNKNILLEVDIQGARAVKKQMPEAVLIFIRPPSLEHLTERIVSRAKDSAEVIKRRLASAESELARADEYDHVIINDDLERAVSKIRAIITKGEAHVQNND